VAWPVTFKGPSMRSMGSPIMSVSSAHLCSLSQRAAERAFRQLDLEVVVTPPDGVFMALR